LDKNKIEDINKKDKGSWFFKC